MDDTISRQAAIDVVMHYGKKIPTYAIACKAGLEKLPSAQPDNDMIHLQKEQAYLKGWEEGRKALRKEMWEDEQDRLD